MASHCGHYMKLSPCYLDNFGRIKMIFTCILLSIPKSMRKMKRNLSFKYKFTSRKQSWICTDLSRNVRGGVDHRDAEFGVASTRGQGTVQMAACDCAVAGRAPGRDHPPGAGAARSPYRSGQSERHVRLLLRQARGPRHRGAGTRAVHFGRWAPVGFPFLPWGSLVFLTFCHD